MQWVELAGEATAAINRCQALALLLSKRLQNMNFWFLTFSSIFVRQAENAWLGQKYKAKETAVYICTYAFEHSQRVNLNPFSELIFEEMIDLHLNSDNCHNRASQIVPSCHLGLENIEEVGRTWRIWRTRRTWNYGKHEPDDLEHSICDSKPFFLGKQMTKNTLFTVFMSMVEKNITYIRHSLIVEPWHT